MGCYSHTDGGGITLHTFKYDQYGQEMISVSMIELFYCVNLNDN